MPLEAAGAPVNKRHGGGRMKKTNGAAGSKNGGISKKSKTAIHEELNFSQIIDDIPVILCRYKPDFTLTYANASFREMFNLGDIDVTGRSLIELLGEEDIKMMADKHREVSSKSPVVTYEHEAEGPCGDIRALRKIEKALFDDRGRPVEFQSMCFDVTEVKTAETNLMESEERYRSMVQNMRELVYVCSSDLRIEFMNPAMEKRIGKKAIGEHCYEMIHGKKKKCEWCRYEEVLKGHYYELEQLSPLDNRYYLVSSSPVYHVDGSISKMTIYRDITDRKHYEQRVQKDQRIMRALSQKVMTAMEEERERVARDLHDSLGQKVVAIQLKAGMLMKQIEKEKNLKDVESLLQLTEDTAVELERLCKGLRPPVLTKVGLSAALKELVIDSEKTWGNPIAMNIDSGMDDKIGDIEATNMYRIAQEALNNILKHSLGTRASLTLRANDGELELEVKDNGKGFETRNLGANGGLGLVGMRERADICGGMFGIRSAPGCGSVVTVTIPIDWRKR